MVTGKILFSLLLKILHYTNNTIRFEEDGQSTVENGGLNKDHLAFCRDNIIQTLTSVFDILFPSLSILCQLNYFSIM